MMKYLVVFVSLLVVAILLGMTSYAVAHNHQPPPEPEVTCHAFHVAFPSQGDWVYFGESELCGENLEWSTIKGPIGVGKLDVEQQRILR